MDGSLLALTHRVFINAYALFPPLRLLLFIRVADTDAGTGIGRYGIKGTASMVLALLIAVT